ncbi:serine hydrolase domain-containing protein [Marinicella rhabdoformis]|uniref:serine hydrolase domain-containing protein n=1 Tax=Marinicella rhabdoformis TaxID=2580566 RepID=UPI0012AEBB48|nr:serine hydrolase domain-containing protein [Marinicella rhabdoformis]
MKYLINVTLLTLVFVTVNAKAFTWPTDTPESQSIDSEGITEAAQLIQTGDYGNIRSLLVIRNGILVHEQYFGNQGEKRPVYSVTKSVGSTLLGIAQLNGATLNINKPMFDYMPQYQNLPGAMNRRNITVHALLSQRHGLDWDEWSTPYGTNENPITYMLSTDDWYQTVLTWPLETAPNQKFTYSTGASSLMSIILNNISGQAPHEFAKQFLFNPLGIEDTHWELLNGGSQQGQGIYIFPNGLEPLGFGLWLKPIDMAKIGELFRLGGVWEGQRLLTQEWINQSITTYSNGNTDPDTFSTSESGYGYQWWVTEFIDKTGRKHHSYYANGYGRQYIFVFPESDTIIVSTADDYNRDGPGMGTLLRQQILPAIITANDFVDISNDLNGSWYDPEMAGQGINIEIINGGQNLWGFWYTFNESGTEQQWFTMQGQVQGDTATFDIISTEGGLFLNNQSPTISKWGTGTVQFKDCFSGKFTFESNGAELSGEIPLTRLTAAGACDPNNKESQENQKHSRIK